MSELAICRRYAGALQQEADSLGIIEEVDEDVAMLLTALDESRELKLLFASPVISVAKKETIIQKLLSDRVTDVFMRLLFLLNEKRRGPLVSGVLAEYRTLRNRQKGIVEAKARSAMKLSDAEVDALKRRLAAHAGADVHLTVEVDPRLLGGVVVRVGDRVYDGSLKRRLSVLQSQLQHGSVLRN